MEKLFKNVIIVAVLCNNVIAEKRTLTWYGGGVECDKKRIFFVKRLCENENVIATKALTADGSIFVITPRFKTGVPATVWKVQESAAGVVLQPLLDRSLHILSNCEAVQNAVDFHLDVMGNLWILDSGTVETLKNPRCTCHPKVVVVNVFMQHVKVKKIDLSLMVQPDSDLQSIVVEYRLGTLPFLYIADAGVGRVIIHDVTRKVQRSVIACAPTLALQLALVKRSPGNNVLVAVRHGQSGWLEAETTELRKTDKRVIFNHINRHMQPIIPLGSELHSIYFRYINERDVLSWKVRHAIINTTAHFIHTPDAGMNTTSVAMDSKKNFLILDSNFANWPMKGKNDQPQHKIYFVPRVKL